MSTDDSSLYTGLDGEPNTGMFGNEVVEEVTAEKIREQEAMLKELTPQLEGIIKMIDGEMDLAIKFIADYVDNNKDDDPLFRSELKAAARYRTYLGELKSKFTLHLNEAKKNG